MRERCWQTFSTPARSGTCLAERFWVEIDFHPAGRFMMQKAKKKMLPVLVSTLAIVALATTPALIKDSQNKKS
jgi:hypothetical protein